MEQLRKNDYGFTLAERVKETLEEYKETIDPFLEFTRLFIEQDEGASRITSKHLFDFFKDWCHEENHSNLARISSSMFARRIAAACKKEGIIIRREKSGERYCCDIKVKGLNDKGKDDDIDIDDPIGEFLGE